MTSSYGIVARLTVAALSLAVVVLAGCHRGGTAGGPSATDVGHPNRGDDATNHFKLTVAKKDSFTLSMPFWTTGLKQGETKAASLAVNRDKRFDQDVTLKFDNLRRRSLLNPPSAVIKNGEPKARIRLESSRRRLLGRLRRQGDGAPDEGVLTPPASSSSPLPKSRCGCPWSTQCLAPCFPEAIGAIKKSGIRYINTDCEILNLIDYYI